MPTSDNLNYSHQNLTTDAAKHHRKMQSDVDDENERSKQKVKLPPVSHPPNTPQHQQQQQVMTKAPARQLPSTVYTANNVSSQTNPHYDVTSMPSNHFVPATANRIRYDLPARPPIHRVAAAGNTSVNRQKVSDAYGSTNHELMDEVNQKPTIFNRDPVPFSTGQFKFSSFMKKMPINRRDWSHFSPFLNRYRAIAVHADRRNLQLNNYHQMDSAYRSWNGSSYALPMTDSVQMQSKSDYMHYSRRLRLPDVAKRSPRSLKIPLSKSGESDVDFFETSSHKSVTEGNHDEKSFAESLEAADTN